MLPDKHRFLKAISAALLAAALSYPVAAAAEAGDLGLCYYWASSLTIDRMEKLLERGGRTAFREVTKVASRDHDEECEVTVRFNKRPSIRRPYYAWVYSSFTKEKMAEINVKGKFEKTVRAIEELFEEGSGHSKLIAADRKTHLRKRARTGGGISTADLQKAIREAMGGSQGKTTKDRTERLLSDVDSPRYKTRRERPDDLAIVIGIETYSDLPEARFAERDAEAVKNHLVALGFPRRNIIHLAGSRAGYSSIRKYVEVWLPRMVKKDSRVFFYFSGHGAPDPSSGKAYIMPWDGDPNYLETTAYSLTHLYERLDKLDAKEVTVVVDSCFSGAGGRSVLAKGARPLVSKVDISAPSHGKLALFSAASASEITATLEEEGHGLFTYYFLKGLSGAAGKKGKISTGSLYRYLKPKVQDAARRQNRDQTPVFSGPKSRVLR